MILKLRNNKESTMQIDLIQEEIEDQNVANSNQDNQSSDEDTGTMTNAKEEV